MNLHVNFHKTMADLLLTIPRVVCGLLLTLDFGSSKFGMPWSPPEKNLNFMEVAYWFPLDVADYGGGIRSFSSIFSLDGGFYRGCRWRFSYIRTSYPTVCLPHPLYHVGSHFYATMGGRYLEHAAGLGFFVGIPLPACAGFRQIWNGSMVANFLRLDSIISMGKTAFMDCYSFGYCLLTLLCRCAGHPQTSCIDPCQIC